MGMRQCVLCLFLPDLPGKLRSNRKVCGVTEAGKWKLVCLDWEEP